MCRLEGRLADRAARAVAHDELRTFDVVAGHVRNPCGAALELRRMAVRIAAVVRRIAAEGGRLNGPRIEVDASLARRDGGHRNTRRLVVRVSAGNPCQDVEGEPHSP